MACDDAASIPPDESYRRTTLGYAQIVSYRYQKANFSIAGERPAILNRDVGEFMSRDDYFSKGIRSTRAPVSPPLEQESKINPFVAVPEAEVGSRKPGSIFTTLPQDGDHFRLLEVLPRVRGIKIQCRLHVCSIRENRNAYEALSYTWKAEWNFLQGDRAENLLKIECNGSEMTVGVNLYHALLYLRHEDSSRLLWADAICIDQSDPVERNQQVAAMGAIFRTASKVLVWLGAEKTTYNPTSEGDVQENLAKSMDSSQAFSGVCSLISTWALESGQPQVNGPPRYRIRGLPQDLFGEGPLTEKSDIWEKILKLYKKSWFKRLWVLQEIALARQATVIWGWSEISWQWIGLAAAVIRTNWHDIVPRRYHLHDRGPEFEFDWDNSIERRTSRQVHVGVMNAYFMYRISRFQGCFEPLRFSFCELLALTRQFRCMHECDKIYGILALPTTDGVNSFVRVDYTQSLDELYRSIALAILHSNEPLALLSNVHHEDIFKDHFDTESAVPSSDSWVPRWHIRGPQVLRPLEAHSDFAAGLSKSAEIKDVNGVSRGEPLVVRGTILDTVICVNGTGNYAFEQVPCQNINLRAQRIRSARENRPVHQMDELEHPENQKQLIASMPTEDEQADQQEKTLDDGAILESSTTTQQVKRSGPDPNMAHSEILYQLVIQKGHTVSSLQKLAITLCAGKSWYGIPFVDRSDNLAGFASCLFAGRLHWALDDGAFGSIPEKKKEGEETSTEDETSRPVTPPSAEDSLSLEKLKEISGGGDEEGFKEAVATACTGRRLFTTEVGMQGVGPHGTRAGDKLCIIHGTPLPFIIRRREESQGYSLVGECYVEDLMRGQGVGDEHEGTWIELV